MKKGLFAIANTYDRELTKLAKVVKNEPCCKKNKKAPKSKKELTEENKKKVEAYAFYLLKKQAKDESWGIDSDFEGEEAEGHFPSELADWEDKARFGGHPIPKDKFEDFEKYKNTSNTGLNLDDLDLDDTDDLLEPEFEDEDDDDDDELALEGEDEDDDFLGEDEGDLDIPSMEDDEEGLDATGASRYNLKTTRKKSKHSFDEDDSLNSFEPFSKKPAKFSEEYDEDGPIDFSQFMEDEDEDDFEL